MTQTPAQWGNALSSLWGKENLPVDVKRVALEFSRMKYPSEPILSVEPFDEDGFEGGLFRLNKGWVILYNSKASFGRQNYTIAHELGHYLLHRTQASEFRCTQKNVSIGYADEVAYEKIEREADLFAAYLLMPADDVRNFLKGKDISLEELGNSAARYGVSLLALAWRWIEITDSTSLLVVSVDGFVLWSVSSKKAFKRKLFKRKGDEVPQDSLASLILEEQNQNYADEGLRLEAGVWFEKYSVHEFCLSSDRYDMQVSVLNVDLDEAPVFDEENDDIDFSLPSF